MKVKDLRVNPLRRTKEKGDEAGPSTSEDKKSEVILPSDSNFNHIKCKAVRLQKYQKLRREKAKAKKLAKKKRIQEGGPKQVPHTLESLREKDETTITGNLDDEENQELKVDFENDEFASYYKHAYEPKVLISFADNPNRKTRIFGRELTRIIPNSISLYRNRSSVKKMVKSAVARNYTDLIVINEDQCRPSILFTLLNYE